MVDLQSDEIKQLKSTIKSQETSIAYLKKKIEELTHQLDKEKQEKLQLKTNMTLGISKQATSESVSLPANSDTSKDGEKSNYDELRHQLALLAPKDVTPSENST